MASTNVIESKLETNYGTVNLENIEFPEGPEDHAPELEIVKLENEKITPVKCNDNVTYLLHSPSYFIVNFCDCEHIIDLED